GVGEVQAPLVVLAEHACGALTVGGSSDLTVSTADGSPGYIAIDSDGSGCGNKKVVLEVNGQGAINADQIAMWALAQNPDSAYRAGLLNPKPVPSSAPVGRSGVDSRYNCKV